VAIREIGKDAFRIRPAGTIPSWNKSYARIEAGWHGSRLIIAALHQGAGSTTGMAWLRTTSPCSISSAANVWAVVRLPGLNGHAVIFFG
jgi:hypothetical protein